MSTAPIAQGPVDVDVRRFGLHAMHPAMVEIASLRERCGELEKELGRPFVVERGPWVASEDGYTISSDDFTHDVLLRVSGDFADTAQRKAYANEIARRLNTTHNAEVTGRASVACEGPR